MDFFSEWVGLFEICFQSSKMTDPRPCPTGWAYLEVYRIQRRHAKLKPTTNYQLQKSIFLKVPLKRIFFHKIKGKCVNMNALYEKLAKV